MAKQYQLTIPAHPNIYDGSQRELELFFCEPDAGINEDTGLLLLTCGFGEYPASSYHTEARATFSDEYNLVTVQCAYFGSRFMGTKVNPKFIMNTSVLENLLSPEEWAKVNGAEQLNLDALFELSHKYPLKLEGVEQMDESLHEFNDMGLMQAVDSLAAYLTVAAILEDNGCQVNTNRMFAYGQGHGAFINHLCNALAPNLFSTQIDNNAWLIPDYLQMPRVLNMHKDLIQYSIIFDYFTRQQPFDREFLYLPSLYKRFVNRCNLICFEDVSDNDGKTSKKQSFYESIPNAMYLESGGVKLASQRIDNDYYRLFDYVMNNFKASTGTRKAIALTNSQIDTKAYRYHIHYINGMPELQRIAK
jgi:hypothetical protein